MYYLEYLRVRRIALIYGTVVTAIVALLFAIALGSTHHSIVIEGAGPVHRAPLSMLVGVAAFLVAIFASVVGTGLNVVSAQLQAVRSKPVAPVRAALQIFGVDLASIAVMFAFVLLLELLLVLVLGDTVRVVVDDATAPVLVMTLGACALWYAWIAAGSAPLARSGSVVTGLSWPIFIIALSAEHLRVPALQAVVRALNTVSPLTYLSFRDRGGVVTYGEGLPLLVVTIVPWLTAVVLAGVAILLWRRREA